MKYILICHLNHSNWIRNEQVMPKIRKLVKTGKQNRVVPVQVGQKRPESKLYRYKFKVYRYMTPELPKLCVFLPFFHMFQPQSTLYLKNTSRPLQIHLMITFLLNSSFNYTSFFNLFMNLFQNHSNMGLNPYTS